MPTLYVPPKIFFYHRGVLVRHVYKYDEYPVDEHLSYSYLINGYEFDVRDLRATPSSPLIDNDPAAHQQAIIAALEQEGSTLAVDAQVTLNDSAPLNHEEQAALTSLYVTYEQLNALGKSHAAIVATCLAIKAELQQLLTSYGQQPEAAS